MSPHALISFDAVAFVGVDVVADVHASAAEVVDQPVGFGLRDEGITTALDDEERSGDVVGVGVSCRR